jgi:serine/threonine protein kinase
VDLHNRNTVRTNDDWVLWRGQSPADGQMHLVKEARPSSPYRPVLLTRLADEFKFLEQFRHPHLLRPLKLDATAGRAVFADAQCNLAQYLEAHGPIPPTLVANVLAMAADALDHLHGRGFLHGSVGTSGLFVTPEGRVAFADFHGHAFKSTDPVPVPNADPKYLAPELIDATTWGKTSPASDLYCLGFLALELLAGPDQFTRLFGVADGADWLRWHSDAYRQLADWRPPLEHAPAGLLDVIAGLIAKRPADRQFQSASHLKSYLVDSRLTSDALLRPYRSRRRGGTVKMLRPPERTRTGTLPKRIPRKPRLTLHPIDGVGKPRVWSPEKAVLAGTGKGCDLISDGRAVAPKHALLLCGQDGVWRVYDLSTAAATFVNGAAVRRAKLYPDDELYFGEVGLRVTLDYDRPKTAFDQFELLAKLHRGSRGTVFRGRWAARDGRAVAVRLFPRRFQFDAGGVRRLLRGVPEAAQVRHPHLVRVYRAGSERVGRQVVWFLATEYMPSGSLRDRIKHRGKLASAEAAAAVRGAAAGAKAITDRGMVHRVINPGCVFPASGGAKLGDFFFARPAQLPADQEATTHLGHRAGDLVYQSPECVQGAAELTPACDVYSLGATLYEAVTGRPPVDPSGPLPAVCEQILAGGIVPASEVVPTLPPAVAAVLAKALHRDPARRYADAGELAAALAGV